MEQKDPQELYSSFFDTILKPINNIYVDLELMQDFKIGALLSMITLKEEIEYIQHNLPKYNKRYDFECAKYFPALKISEHDINLRLKSEAQNIFITTMSPFNGVWSIFANCLVDIGHHNDMTKNNVKTRIVFNIADIPYPDPLKIDITDNVNKYLHNVDVQFTQYERYDETDLSGYDLLFIYDLPQFVKPDTTTSKQFFREGKFANARIYTVPRKSKDKQIPDDKLDFAFEATHKWLQLFCDELFFINDLLPTYRQPEEPKVKEDKE